MQNENDKSCKKIYFAPDSVAHLLKTMKGCGNYRICFDDINHLDVPDSDSSGGRCIYTGFVQELSVLKRGERYFEMGAGLRISEILKKSASVLPPILVRALRESGTPNMRNIITLGGLLCGSRIKNSLYTVLSILNAKLEIHSAATVRERTIVPLSQICHDGSISLLPGEMMTKIRIPYEDYDADYYNEVLDKENTITFAGVASIFKNTISVCKFAIGNFGSEIVRETEIENGLAEQKLPIPEKTLEGWRDKFALIFNEKYTSFSPYVQKALINMFTEFLGKL